MASQALCAYCFESLAANFESGHTLGLTQVEELWEQYHASTGKDGLQIPDDVEDGTQNDEDAEMTDVEDEERSTARPAAISRLLNRQSTRSQSAASSSSSLPSTTSGSSSLQSSKNASASGISASSMSSMSSLSSPSRTGLVSRGKFPLFVTWNTVSRSGHKSLRGCIGTYQAQELEHGLRSYALMSAFEDARFQPIPSSLLPSLSVHVTLLSNFSTPTKDPMDWVLGKHGIRISFTSHGRIHGSTYLPDVPKELGWTKEETLISLMRKAGWNGSSSSWRKTWRDGKGELVTYEGEQVGLRYNEWREWRDWVDAEGVKSKTLN